VYGSDTGISYGVSASHYKFKNGRTLDIGGPWSATMVKEDGRWRILTCHASVGAFDNPLLTAARDALYWWCGIAGCVGLLVGMLGLALVRRGKKA